MQWKLKGNKPKDKMSCDGVETRKADSSSITVEYSKERKELVIYNKGVIERRITGVERIQEYRHPKVVFIILQGDNTKNTLVLREEANKYDIVAGL